MYFAFFDFCFIFQQSESESDVDVDGENPNAGEDVDVPQGRVLPRFGPLQLLPQPNIPQQLQQQQIQQIIPVPLPPQVQLPQNPVVVGGHVPHNQVPPVPQLTRRSPRKNIGVPPTRYPY